LPAVHRSHRDLARSQQSPEQHRRGFRRGQHRLGLDPPLEAALTHAEAREKVKANPHLTEAIKHLKEAIDEGKQGHADVATTHVEAALNHL
jgi:diketogulonate reductase-like aldo/keto reductase